MKETKGHIRTTLMRKRSERWMISTVEQNVQVRCCKDSMICKLVTVTGKWIYVCAKRGNTEAWQQVGMPRQTGLYLEDYGGVGKTKDFKQLSKGVAWANFINLILATQWWVFWRKQLEVYLVSPPKVNFYPLPVLKRGITENLRKKN